MSNVLPFEETKRLKRRLRTRFILLGALIILASALVAMLALAPAFVSVQFGKAAFQKAESEISAQMRDDQAKQARALVLIGALAPVVQATSSSPTEMISFAIGLKPQGMSITNISYKKAEIVLSGVASNRLAVNDFREALTKSGRFKSVVVPVAALVGAQEGRFTVTLSGF